MSQQAINFETVYHAWHVDIWSLGISHSTELLSVWDLVYWHDISAHIWQLREAAMAQYIERTFKDNYTNKEVKQ